VLICVKSTEYSQATTVVYTQEYPITVSMVGIGQISRLIARCLPIISWIPQCTHMDITQNLLKINK